MTSQTGDTPAWLIPSRVYDVLKWVGLIVCPALAVLFGTVAQAWGMEASIASAVVLTVNAIGTFIGAIIGVSQGKAYLDAKKGDDADGE